MHWYYANGDRQTGPVTESDIRRLLAEGAIEGATLVWHTGMTEWRPCAEFFPAVPAAFIPASASPGETAPCKDCGRIFPVSSMSRLYGALTCPACLPGLSSKRVAEQPAPVALRYAGFWVRFLAAFLDGILLAGIAFFISTFVVVLMLTGLDADAPPALGIGVRVALNLFSALVGMTYHVFFVGRFGATPGKMACGLRIVRADGSPVSYARALGRYGAEWVSGMILMMGYIIAAFDVEKRALHDHLCDTRVVWK